MRIIEFFSQNKKKFGIRKAVSNVIQYGFQKLLGVEGLQTRINEQQEEINTLFFFLNEYADIKNISPAGGDLRAFQNNDVSLLQIFHSICSEYRLTYWLSWGTLLGAVRHKGFIPWDDDLDVDMDSESFDTAVKYYRNCLNRWDFMFI